MADESKALTLFPRREPSLRPISIPTAGSSGAIGTRTRILRKDTEYLELSNRRLNARLAEATTTRALVDARIALGRSLTDIAALPEICAAHFLKGRRQRANELLVHELKCQTEESNARASL